MNRREFLAGATAVAAATVVPAVSYVAWPGNFVVMGLDLASGPDRAAVAVISRRGGVIRTVCDYELVVDVVGDRRRTRLLVNPLEIDLPSADGPTQESA